jgi:hypothetical protein
MFRQPFISAAFIPEFDFATTTSPIRIIHVAHWLGWAPLTISIAMKLCKMGTWKATAEVQPVCVCGDQMFEMASLLQAQ